MTYKNISCSLLAILMISLIPFTWAASPCKAFLYNMPGSGPLSAVNCNFHTVYTQRIQKIINYFGAVNGRPVIMNLGGKLLFKYNGTIEQVNINPKAFHELKAFSHAVFSIYLILTSQPPGALSTQQLLDLKQLNNSLQLAEKNIAQSDLTSDQQIICLHLAKPTILFLHKLLNTKLYKRSELKQYYQQMHQPLKQAIYQSAKIELTLLDNAINRWLKQLSTEEKKQLAVVVATSHQARSDELSLQYFTHKLGFQYGPGAYSEHNFVVLEDKFDEVSAQQLLARHFLDREAANIIFNNKKELQKDVLSNTTKQLLLNFNAIHPKK